MNKQSKKNCRKVDWEKTPQYREAILLKVLRAMKSYGYQEWMSVELKNIGMSI